MRNQVGNSALAELHTLDLAELVLCLLIGDTVDGEAALGVVDETEVLAGLLDRDNVHQTRGEGGVGADLAVDLDEALHEDGIDLAGVERVLQAVAEENDQRQRVAELVRTGGSLGGIGTFKLSVLMPKCRIRCSCDCGSPQHVKHTGQLVQEPVRGGAEALLVLLWTTTHFDCCFVRLVV